ncbi:MAG: TetR/AcrR family transcriptional regulator [Eggerthellaceae bacterium]|nr:TetR/AcrR family transcriptional regulator [Eggerthellaceae bacterium]
MPTGAGVSQTSAPTDRRIARTRRALRRALIELTEERGLDGFTVNDLCARADLNRGTFYNHFRDKDDLLVTLEDEVMEGLFRFRGEINKITLVDLAKLKVSKEPLPLLVELFDYLGEQADFLHAMLGPGGDVKFAPRLRDSICSDLILGLLHERYRSDPTPFVQYYVAFYASAYVGVITRWLEGGMQESSEDMARIAMRLLFIKPGESIKL